jgi:putative transposase
MYRISRFHHIMKALPRGTFDRIVQTHQADKHSKGFGCWDQLIAMVYAQLSGASSLRVLETGFNSQHTQHYHLGATPIKRSTLSDANSKRKAEVFADIAKLLMSSANRSLRRESEELLYLLDSSSISLKGPGFDTWTSGNSTRNTQGIKLHVLFAGNEEIPLQHSITAPNVNDIDEGRKLTIEPAAVYVFDKGYCDYNWWYKINEQKAQFVTRFKRNAALIVERELSIPAKDAAIVLKDEIVRFTNKHPRGGRKNLYATPLRRVTVVRPDHDQPLLLATNDLVSPASVIARRYKDRWGIELFFKWIKQHLKIKSFLGRNENAVRIQILTALITYLLLAIYRKAQNYSGSLWILLAEVRATLFQRPAVEAERYRRRRNNMAEFAARQGGLFA